MHSLLDKIHGNDHRYPKRARSKKTVMLEPQPPQNASLYSTTMKQSKDKMRIRLRPS